MIDRVQQFIDEHRPADVSITFDQFRRATRSMGWGAGSAWTIRYDRSVNSTEVTYVAVIKGYEMFTDESGMASVCAELGIPFRLAVPFPEPTILMPEPSWIEDWRWPYPRRMFKSDAQQARDQLCADALSEVKAYSAEVDHLLGMTG